MELDLPAAGAMALASAGARAHAAADQLTREGIAVRWVRSVFRPEDETCLLVFEAASGDAVDRAGRRAELAYVRIVEAGPGGKR